jgi:hypothetical protein
MTSKSVPIEAQRQRVEEFTKAGARILSQRGVYGGARPAALAWLLTFVQDDLRIKSFGEWADRWAEVKRFALDGGLGSNEPPLSDQEGLSLTLPGRFSSPFTASRSFPGPGEKDALILLQQAIKSDLDTYVDQGSATTFALAIKLTVRKEAPRIEVESADITVAFQYQAFHLIGELGTRIRRCRRCQRLFLAGRSDKQFCSGTCQAMMWKDEHPPKRTRKTKPKGRHLKKGRADHAKR